MSLVNIKAKFECDGCGSAFSVDIDPTYKAPAEWSMFDVAVDSVRGELSSSVSNDDRHLCKDCTKKEDEADEQAQG